MNIDGLKLILETIQAAGEGAYSIALFYFGYQLIKFILTGGLVFFGLLSAGKLIKEAIISNSFKWKIADLFGIKYFINEAEKKAIIKWIAENKPPTISGIY